jgi:type II secretory pathway component GspD/PulD (secretin)
MKFGRLHYIAVHFSLAIAVLASSKAAKAQTTAEAVRRAERSAERIRHQDAEPETSHSIRRATEPNTPADPEELDVKADIDGRISLTLRGQKWVDVLQMLADLSEMAIEWTHLPNDVVDFTTPGRVTLDVVRDTLNRMLLDRGYTMLRYNDTLSVHKVKNLNRGLVPRIAPEHLERRDPHEFVKVSFKLGKWLGSEAVAKDLAFMTSSNGTLNAIPAANRIEAVDTVINLGQIRDVLAEERAASGEKKRIRVFYIEYRSAADVNEMLKGLLGIDSESREPLASISPQQQIEMQWQMQRELARLRRQQRRQSNAPTVPPKHVVRLVVNQRQNTILAHAPPEKMAIIEQAIEAIDVPASQAQSLPDRLLRMKIYKLATMNPEPLISMLEEIGGLNFNTVLKADTKANAIVAYATLADHVTIDALVNKLDGSARKFQVIPLSRLRADYVAGTIQFMMGTGEKVQNDRRSYYYSQATEEEAAETDVFRVDADVENNWLLVRANESEMREIDDLLVQLGEKRLDGAIHSTVRYLDTPAGEEMDVVLRRIQRVWPRMAPNELRIEPAIEQDEVDESLEPPRALSQIGTQG